MRKKVAEQGTGHVKGEGKGRGQVFAGWSLIFDVYKEPYLGDKSILYVSV